MSEEQSANEPTPEPQPEPLKFDAPTFDYIERGGDQGDLETRDQPDMEHK